MTREQAEKLKSLVVKASATMRPSEWISLIDAIEATAKQTEQRRKRRKEFLKNPDGPQMA